jgi:hypothetical protein
MILTFGISRDLELKKLDGAKNPDEVISLWQYGSYQNPRLASEIITPEFLSSLEVSDPRFEDAVYILYATDQDIMLHFPEKLTPLARIIFNEVQYRGDATIRVFLKLINEALESREKGIHNRLLTSTAAFKTIDSMPFLEYARAFVRNNPEDAKNGKAHSGIKAILMSCGEEQDIPLLVQIGVDDFSRIEKRLAQEKIDGKTEIQKRREYGASVWQQLDVQRKSKPLPQPPKKLPTSTSGNQNLVLWPLIILIGLPVFLVVIFRRGKGAI